MTTTMPGVIAKNQLAETVIEFSPEDIVTILRAKLSAAESDAAEKFKQALLDIPQKAAVDWVRYFLSKLG